MFQRVDVDVGDPVDGGVLVLVAALVPVLFAVEGVVEEVVRGGASLVGGGAPELVGAPGVGWVLSLEQAGRTAPAAISNAIAGPNQDCIIVFSLPACSCRLP